MLSSMVSFNNQLFLTKDNGEIFTFDKSLKNFSSEKDQQNARLIVAEEKLWLVQIKEFSDIKNNKIKPFSETEKDSLTDNFVSALAFDKNENLWLGTFRTALTFSPRTAKNSNISNTKRCAKLIFCKRMTRKFPPRLPAV